MNLISKINSKDMIEDFCQFSNIVILGTEFSLRTQVEYTLDEISALVKTYDKCTFFVEINKIIHEDELNDVTNFIDKLALITDQNVGIVFQDLGVLNHIQELNYNFCLNYDPLTYVTSSKQVDFYHNQGVNYVTLSREITTLEIKKILANVCNSQDVWMQGFGLTQMLHSKRNLLQNYVDFEFHTFGNKISVDLENMSLYDEERKQYYPLIIHRNETFIMSPQTLNVLDDIIKLQKYGINNLVLDFSNQTLSATKQILKIYANIINLINANTPNDVITSQIKIDSDLIKQIAHNGAGFGLLYKKTMYKI